jgi:hypothetical protein
MITDQKIAQAFSDLSSTCGGTREDYFGLLYLEQEHGLAREKAVNQAAFGGHDYGFDDFHFDEQKHNLYIYQFKYTKSHLQFKGSFQRLIEDGMERIFSAPTKDDAKNQIMLQLRTCLLENKAIIDQVFFRLVFTGDPQEADNSPVLEKLREDLESKKYYLDQFFGSEVGFTVQFRSATGKVGLPPPPVVAPFEISLTSLVEFSGPAGQKMHLGFIRLADLHAMFKVLGKRFFDSNIRYGFEEGDSAVNRAIAGALKKIIIDKAEDPSLFAFDHNGITLAAGRFEAGDGICTLTAPRLLNGAQTVTTFAEFLKKNSDDPRLLAGKQQRESLRVLCKVITDADQKFVTRVTINNNRQNPVEPWNLHANDVIQLELWEKFQTDLKIFYERQENAFDQLGPEDLDEYGIAEDSKAIQMLKLTQTFLLTDGSISRMSHMPRVFEDEKTYEHVFRQARLRADSRHILLCYKVQFNLRKYVQAIQDMGQNKYWFLSRARNLVWALLCQGILNATDLEDFAEKHGNSLSAPVEYKERLITLATSRVRPLLKELIEDQEYKDEVAKEKFSFLNSDKAFDKCMESAYKRWKWVHKKLGVAAVAAHAAH